MSTQTLHPRLRCLGIIRRVTILIATKTRQLHPRPLQILLILLLGSHLCHLSLPHALLPHIGILGPNLLIGTSDLMVILLLAAQPPGSILVLLSRPLNDHGCFYLVVILVFLSQRVRPRITSVFVQERAIGWGCAPRGLQF